MSGNCAFPPFDEELRSQNFLTLTIGFPGPRGPGNCGKVDAPLRRDGAPATVKLLFHSVSIDAVR
jgi:hypothetical protein